MILASKQAGEVPFFVNATAGTTILGVFDGMLPSAMGHFGLSADDVALPDLNAIADVCQRHGLWLHVDASWGGTVLLSEKHKHLMAGVERVSQRLSADALHTHCEF